MAPRTLSAYHCSQQQERRSRLKDAGMLAPLQAIVRVRTTLDGAGVQRAWEKLTAAYPVLAVRIGQVPGEDGPLQIVGEAAAAFSDEPGLLHGDASPIETQLRVLGDRECVLIDAEAPRARLALVRGPAGDSWLVITVASECCDASSLELLTRQLLDVCESGAAPSAEEIDYFQYAEWQHNVMREADAAELSKYWHAQLHEGASPLAFMPRVADPHVVRAPAIAARAVLSETVVTGLRSLSARLAASPAQVALASVANVLSRLTGMDALCVGWSFDGRTTPELERTIGPLDEVLPVILRVAADDTAASLICRVRDAVEEAADRQDFVDWDDLSSSLGHRGAIMPFSMEWLVLDADDGPDAGHEVVDLRGGEAAYEVKLTVVQRGPGIEGAGIEGAGIEACWTYAPDRVDALFVEQLSTQWLDMLPRFVAAADTAVAEMSICHETERRRLLDEFAGRPISVPGQRSILDLIDEQVRDRADAIALRSEGVCLTYATFDRRVRRVATAMRAHVSEGLIGIDATFGPDAIVLMVAAMRAGLTYVPVDMQQPTERLGALANEGGLLVVFGTRSESSCETGRIRYVALDETTEVLELPEELPDVPPQAPAYVILTSGSTGTPKGVTISHDSLARSTFARLAYYREPVERFLLLSPLHVDSSVAGIYWTLSCGGELLLPSDTDRRDATQIGELLRSSQISHLLCIPSLYRLVLETMRPDQPGALRTAIVAAEPCQRELVSRHELVMPETMLYNEYGPSEGTVWASVLACQGFPYARISIGRPAPHVCVSVLDGRGETTAIGQTGEIHLGGAIASGYWKNPRETAHRFVPDALSGAIGAVLYRSGDYGAWNADASLTFSGRRDDQVKILGFRVELAEVCEAIESHAAVREACVRFLPERGELVAYVVPADPAVADLRALLKLHLRGALPRFMHPQHWIMLPDLPTLPGGKVDTQKLPAPALESAPAATLPALDDPLESLVAAIWQHCLPGRAVGRGDSFFAVGGNSLNGIQIVSRLQEALQTDVVSIRQLFEFPVLSDFTRELHRLLGERSGSATLDEEPLDALVDSGQPQPASFFQERLFFLHLLDPTGSAYNCPFAIRLEGQIDASSIQTCLRQLQEKHAALRTTLRMRDGVLHQDLGIADITLRHVDLRSSDRGPSDIDALILEEGSAPFDLQGGALFRATLFTLDSQTCVLVAVVHHAVFDGWSLRILVSDFKRLYHERQATAGLPASAPVLTYTAYSRWQRRQWDRGVWGNQLQYWTGQLRDAAGLLAMPTDRPRREGQQFRGDTLHFEWPAAVAERVRQVCRERNITTFIFFEALLALVLHRYSGQADVLIGTPVANRRRPPTEEVIGPVANTVVVRHAFATPQTWNDLLAQVRSTVVQAYCNQDVPFEKVVDALQPVRTLAASPLFQVMFVMQNVPVEPFELEGLCCEVIPHRSRSAKFDLTLSLFDRAPEIRGQLEYNSALFDRETMERLVRNFERTLQSVLDEPQASVEQLDVISEPEKRLLRTWNPVSTPDQGLTLVSLFEAQMARAPDAIAVSFDGAVSSYATLDRRANQLANHLLARGVTPDTPVAVLAERSLELVISLLAILKAGCAYLPLDGDAPAARLQRIWTRAGRPYAITDRRRAPCAFLEDREICWAADAPAIDHAAIDSPGVQVDADQLAYVIYTSGSTGEPKGVMVPHRGIVNRLRWMQQELDLSPHDVVLQKTPYTFDVSVWEFFWPLVEGARLALAPPGWHKDPDALQRVLGVEQVSYTHFVPSMLGAFMQVRRFEELRALRGVVCSGESLDPQLCERFFAQAPVTRLYNMYGPTEASVDVSSWPCRAGEDSVPIGRPIDGAQLHIASAAQAPVPFGGAGELLIGGIGLARGYWADPRTTARAFIPDHRSDAPGARLYRSGDLARYRRDGAIEFLGRSDSQIKLRGIRIELGEIEHALRTFEGVADVAVIAQGAGTPDARIAAYVTGIEATASEDLKKHAATVLPAYMVPADVLVLEEMPRLSSGKVDSASLARRELPRRGTLVAYVPAGETERGLAGLWMRHLRLDAIDANASFFAAGGHSLAAIAMLADVNRDFEINMGLPAFLESRSFLDLAARIDGLRHLRDSRAARSDSCAPGEVEGSL
jgi:amino acid adenylation domain-containing protein